MSLAVGVIGAGVMGAEHARLLREATSDAHLADVCDADAGRAKAAAHGAAVFTDAKALIALTRFRRSSSPRPMPSMPDMRWPALRR